MMNTFLGKKLASSSFCQILNLQTGGGEATQPPDKQQICLPSQVKRVLMSCFNIGSKMIYLIFGATLQWMFGELHPQFLS